MVIDLSARPLSQQQFATVVGVSEPRISQMVKDGQLPADGTIGDWLAAYITRLRDQAAGRMGDGANGLDLVQERAALARSQRERIDLQNAVARGQHAPIDMLRDVLAKTIAIMVSELEQVDGLIAQTAPDLPEPTRLAVLNTIAAARNKIATRSADLVLADIDPADDIDADYAGVGAADALDA